MVGLVWVVNDAGCQQVYLDERLRWLAFFITLYAGLTMVTNAPLLFLQDVNFKQSVPFVGRGHRVGLAVVGLHPPKVLFCFFLVWFCSPVISFTRSGS